MKKMNLRHQLLVGGAMLVAIPMLVLCTFTVLKTNKTFTELSESTSSQSAEKLCETVRTIIDEEIKKVRALSGLANVAIVSSKIDREGRESAKEQIESLNEELSTILKNLGDQYAGIFLTDKNGLFVSGARSEGDLAPYRNMNVSDRDYFKTAKEDGKANVGSLVKSKTNNKPVMMACLPLKSEKGEFLGILALASKVDLLIETVAGTKIGRTGYAFMVDAKGMMIAHPKQDLILELDATKTPGMSEFAKKMVGQIRGSDSYTFEGVEKLVSFAPVGIRGWSIAAMQPKDEVTSTAREFRNQELLIAGGLLGLALIVTFLFGRTVSKPISGAVKGLFEVSDQVALAAHQISTSSQQLAEGSSVQAASIEETSASLEEVSSMTKQNADNSNQANQLMTGTKDIVSRASESMKQLTVSMVEISKASEETSKIIKTIDEIAFQTNLLALNAAVEAARAGEAGAGFAVVADEVRNLAMRAAEAARSTADLIEGTIKKVKEGSELTGKTDKEFHEVAVSVEKSGELVGEIAAASHEQAQGIEQVNKAVSEMDKVVQQNAANAEKSASASEEMNAQAERMKEFVGELVSLTGGADGVSVSAKRAESVNRKNTLKKTVQPPFNAFVPVEKKGNGSSQKGNGKLLTSYGRRESGAEQVIPFDDEEISQF